MKDLTTSGAYVVGLLVSGLLAAGCSVVTEHEVRDRKPWSFINTCTDVVMDAGAEAGVEAGVEARVERCTEIEDLDVDEDCDGAADEGCPCALAVERPCGFRTRDCRAGTQTCRDGAWSSCEGATVPVEETCDTRDNDCDDRIDENAIDAVTYYRDIDMDGFGDPEVIVLGCDAPTGFVADSSDCDDDCNGCHPGGREICGDGRDNDCDGAADWVRGNATPIFPPNGYLTGSALAPPEAAVADHPLRPRLMWKHGTCAPEYQVQMDDSCSYPGFRDCAFDSPEVDERTTEATFRPSAPLPVSMSAPVGRRYAWRVRACDEEGCTDWSEPRYLDVGLQEHDYNGDGHADIVVGSPEQANPTAAEGVVHVYYGNAAGTPGEPPLPGDLSDPPNREPSQVLANPINLTRTFFGARVLGGGDVNGDGFADLIVGAPAHANRENEEGLVFVYHGSATGLPAAPSLIIDSPFGQPGNHFSQSISSAGDVDGDGFADLIVGSPLLDNPEEEEGSAFLYYGSSSGLSALPAVILDNPLDQAGGAFASAITGGQDLNGDGYADIVVGALEQRTPEPGRGVTYVYYGRAERDPPPAEWSPSLTLSNPSDPRHDGFGAALLIPGDLNGDGYAELIVTVPGHNEPDLYGAVVYLYYGSGEGLARSPAAEIPNPDLANYSQFGFGPTWGDMNGDGFADLILGDHYAQAPGWFPRVYFFEGSSAGPALTPSRTLFAPEDPPQNGWFGISVSRSDFNGDGYWDLVIGESQMSNPEGGEGSVQVYLGGPDGISVVPIVTLDNPNDRAWQRWGAPVASALRPGPAEAVAAGLVEGAELAERWGRSAHPQASDTREPHLPKPTRLAFTSGALRAPAG